MKTLTEHNAMIDSCVNDTKVGAGVLCPMCFEYKEEIQMYFLFILMKIYLQFSL